jgi:hypothetical protein
MHASLLLTDPIVDQLHALTTLVHELRDEVGQLRAENAQLRQQVSELKCEVGYWKSRNADSVGRKNYYGSGSEWSGRLAMMLFSIFATLGLWKINPLTWLNWYFEACAACGGKAPAEPASFLPWNLCEERLAALQVSSTNSQKPNTS